MKVIIKNLQKKISFHPKRIRKTVLNTLSSEGIKNPGEITIFFVDDKKIKELNLRYLHKDNATDVITFDISEPNISDNIVADIAISTDRVMANARIYKTSPLYELRLYIIHGILHLLGYNDKNARQRKIMDAKARDILATLNKITCPSTKPKP